MLPHQFWTSTMEEVELVIKGNVDRWRMDRRNAYSIVRSSGMLKNPPSITDMFPLPYDDEIGGGRMSDTEIEELYNQYKGLL